MTMTTEPGVKRLRLRYRPARWLAVLVSLLVAVVLLIMIVIGLTWLRFLVVGLVMTGCGPWPTQGG
jgi:Na+(H+)/acetate symporter ActP